MHLIISKELKEILAPVSADFTYLPVTLSTYDGRLFPYYILYAHSFSFYAHEGELSQSDIDFYVSNFLEKKIEFFGVKNYLSLPKDM